MHTSLFGCKQLPMEELDRSILSPMLCGNCESIISVISVVIVIIVFYYIC